MKLNMVFLKINDLIVFVIFLLSLNECYSPSGENVNLDITLNVPQSSSKSYKKPGRREPKKPEEVENIIRNRRTCIDDIYAVFARNESPEEHIRFAFKNLTLLSENLNENAHFYYSTFYRYVSPGNLIPFMEHYINFPEEHRGDEQVNAQGSLKGLFDVPTLELVVSNALYNLTFNMVDGTRNWCFLAYFELILQKLIINLNPQLVVAYRGPYEICKAKYPMPAKYKRWSNEPLI